MLKLQGSRNLLILKHLNASMLCLAALLISACSVGTEDNQLRHTVMVKATGGGIAGANNILVLDGQSTLIALTPYPGFVLANAAGCGGSVQDGMFKTAEITESCSVEALFLPMQTISTQVHGAGSISPSQAVLAYGQGSQFEITPDAGHALTEISGCGGQLLGNQYQVSSVTSNCQISARFAPLHTVSLSSMQEGQVQFSIANVPTQSVNEYDFIEGERAAITVSPAPGYAIAAVTGCGGSLDGQIYTTAALSQDCTINAQFIALHDVTSQTSGNGSISPAVASVRHGEQAEFNVTAAPGYLLAGISGCSGSLVASTYTTDNITSSCQINANFVAIHRINAQASGNGSISPTFRDAIAGSQATFELSPHQGYAVSNISGCGGTLNGNTYTTSSINAACSISANFIAEHQVTTNADSNGAISPASATVTEGSDTSFNVTPNAGFAIDTVTGCGGSLNGNTYTTASISAACSINANFIAEHNVTTNAGSNGAISPASATVTEGSDTSFNITPNAGFAIDTVTGCGGNLVGNTYTTASVSADCTVTASFIAEHHVTTNAGSNGAISPASATVAEGNNTSFNITPNAGFAIDTVTGCGGNLVGSTYTTENITADCSVEVSFIEEFTISTAASSYGSISPSTVTDVQGSTQVFTITPNAGFAIDIVNGCGGSLSGNTFTIPALGGDCTISTSYSLTFNASTPSLSYEANNIARLTWTDVPNASHYKVLQNRDGLSGFSQVGSDIAAGNELFDHDIALHLDFNTQYILQSCLQDLCTDSPAVTVDATQLVNSISYIKASNTDPYDFFGSAISVSQDGSTIAVGAKGEESDDPANQQNDAADSAGAVYIFQKTNGTWAQQAYLKATNAQQHDQFAFSLALSADGNTLVVGAPYEDGNGTGLNGDPSNNDATNAGAAYVFRRTNGSWAQTDYIKASNTDPFDVFGKNVAISDDGLYIAVSAPAENSPATGIGGDQSDQGAANLSDAGAVYLFNYQNSAWQQTAYVKAPNTSAYDAFGHSIRLSASSPITLAIGNYQEDGSHAGVNPPFNDSSNNTGAVWIYDEVNGALQYSDYIKASNTGSSDFFGHDIDLSSDGRTLAVGAVYEDDSSSGVGAPNGDAVPLITQSGAVYVYQRGGIGQTWFEQAYIKASNTGQGDSFGWAVSLSADGNHLAASAVNEDSNSAGINNDQTNNDLNGTGAVYVFSRNGSSWSQTSYIKAPNRDYLDSFGTHLTISGDGNTLVVGTPNEDNSETGINPPDNPVAASSGAIYVY